MKCLSVSQPFADLIVAGRKTVELRRWNTNFRGEFLVHAPLKIREDDAKRLKMNSEFITGAIIGKAEIYDVKMYETASQCRRDHRLHLASKKFYENRYGFMLRNATALRVPIPYSGRLGFFKVNLGTKISDSEVVSNIIEEEHRYRLVGHH